MNDERRNRKNLDKLMEITKAPLIDKLEKALEENTTLKEVNEDLLEALKRISNVMSGDGLSKAQLRNQLQFTIRTSKQAISKPEERKQ